VADTHATLRVLGIVTARGGSKGIPRKNLVDVGGKPLLAWTAEAALASSRLSRVVLSTDDQEIAEVGQSLGLDVPFMRPAELAKDDTPTLPVLQDVVRRLEAKGEDYDAIFILQPTNVLRLTSDIDGAIELLERTGADSVISFVQVGDKHIARMKEIHAGGRVVDPPFAEAFEGQPRQALPKLYLREGSVYVTRRDVLMEQDSIKGRDCRAWMIPLNRECNIDKEIEIKLATLMLPDRDKYPGAPAE
jgi:CMP-N-acetylneuraminic acid synthetase